MARSDQWSDHTTGLIDARICWRRYMSLTISARQSNNAYAKHTMYREAKAWLEEHFRFIERAASARFPEMWHRQR